MKNNILGKGWLPYFHKLVSWGVDEDIAIFYLGVLNNELLGDWEIEDEDPFEEFDDDFDWNDKENILEDIENCKKEFANDYNFYRYEIWSKE